MSKNSSVTRMMRPVWIYLIAGMLLTSACAAPAQELATNPPTISPAPPTLPPVPTPANTFTVSPTPLPPEHRIGVRVVNDAGEFYDRLTGETFIPRGYNYARVAPMSAVDPNLWHATLNPGFYEPERAEAALQAMQAEGYNVVRVFVDCCRKGCNAGDPRGGVSSAYLANVVDFLNKAKAHQIYVILVLDLTPAEGGYDDMWQHCCTTYDGENLRYLTIGGHSGERRFNRDFIKALIQSRAPLDAIFAYDLTNEVHFSMDQPPLSLTEGKVTTANRKTYDLSLGSAEKQRLMDENLVYWIDQQRANILAVDPTALVTVSFPAINVGRTTVDPSPAIYQSSADFVDLHAYLGWGLSLAKYMQRFGLSQPSAKPVILGEFGSARQAFLNAEDAAQALMAMQIESCAYGIDGWLMWTWDTEEQTDLYHGVTDAGQISRALSPAYRPDPCQMDEN